MALSDVFHVVRGRCSDTGKEFKLARKEIMPAYKVRGEDEFDSIFEAVHTCIRAAHSWRALSPSVKFYVETIRRPMPGPPKVSS